MFGRSNNDTQLWQQILQSLASDTDYQNRLDTLLSMVCNLTGMPACYLYLLDDSGQHFYLERSRLTAISDDRDETSSILAGEDTEYGVENVMGTPPLDIPHTTKTQIDQTISTPTGQLYSVPLYLAAELQAGAPPPIGLLQVGPLAGQNAPRQLKRNLETIRFPLALATQQARQKESLQQQLAVVTARSEVGQRLLGSALEVNRFVNLLLDLVLNATRTEAGFVAIMEPNTHQLTIRAQANMPSTFTEQVDLNPKSGLFDWSLGIEGGTLLVRDLDFAENLNMRSMLAVPLVESNEPLGVFALVNFERADTFDEHNLILLETFAEQIKLVIHNGRLFESFTTQYLETVKGLTQSLDARHPYTQNHHQHVSQLATTLAQEMGLDTDEVEAIGTAGLIHDVGMAGIVEVEGGFQADFEHPTIGASIIEALPLHPAVAGAVRTHHEWFDGWGFPKGIKGEEIPIGGRILAMAEFITEMTTENPLRKPWSSQKLLSELELRRESQFDPHVTDIALNLIQEQKIHINTSSTEQ